MGRQKSGHLGRLVNWGKTIDQWSVGLFWLYKWLSEQWFSGLFVGVCGKNQWKNKLIVWRLWNFVWIFGSVWVESHFEVIVDFKGCLNRNVAFKCNSFITYWKLQRISNPTRNLKIPLIQIPKSRFLWARVARARTKTPVNNLWRSAAETHTTNHAALPPSYVPLC